MIRTQEEHKAYQSLINRWRNDCPSIDDKKSFLEFEVWVSQNRDRLLNKPLKANKGVK